MLLLLFSGYVRRKGAAVLMPAQAPAPEDEEAMLLILCALAATSRGQPEIDHADE